MSGTQAVIAGILAVFGVGVWLWAKVKAGGKLEADATLRDAEIARQAQQAKILQTQREAAATQAKKDLDDQVDKILTLAPEARLDAALALLAKLRGVH